MAEFWGHELPPDPPPKRTPDWGGVFMCVYILAWMFLMVWIVNLP